MGTLEAWPLSDWQVRIDALATQAAKAHELAARETETSPVTVKMPPRVIHDRPELDEYLEELRTAIGSQLDAGDSVVIR